MTKPKNLTAAKSQLNQAAARYFVEPVHFMLAFNAAPVEAMVALRDDPKAHGPIKAWLGTYRIATLRKHVITAARHVLRISAPEKVRMTLAQPSKDMP